MQNIRHENGKTVHDFAALALGRELETFVSVMRLSCPSKFEPSLVTKNWISFNVLETGRTALWGHVFEKHVEQKLMLRLLHNRRQDCIRISSHVSDVSVDLISTVCVSNQALFKKL